MIQSPYGNDTFHYNLTEKHYPSIEKILQKTFLRTHVNLDIKEKDEQQIYEKKKQKQQTHNSEHYFRFHQITLSKSTHFPYAVLQYKN